MTHSRSTRQQIVLLVLALGLLGTAAYRLRNHFARLVGRHRREGPPSSLTPERQAALQEESRRRRCVVYVVPPASRLFRGTLANPPPPSIEIGVSLPTGAVSKAFRIFAGEDRQQVAALTDRQPSVHQESPPRMELRRYQVEAADGRCWAVELPCPPLLQGLRAAGAEDSITLSWEAPDVSRGRWLKKPEIVIERIDARREIPAMAQGAPEADVPINDASAATYERSEIYRRVRFKELARMPATASRYEDRAVRADGTYLYRVAVVGTVQAKVRNPETGLVETPGRSVRGVAPVHNLLHAVVAVAESPKPLRVAIIDGASHLPAEAGEEGGAPPFPPATRAVREALHGQPWLVLTMRTAPQLVAEEKTVTAMGQDEHGVTTREMLPAEVCLHVSRPTPREQVVSVWMEDYLNGRYLLLARCPMEPSQILQDKVRRGLAEHFPERARIEVPEEEPSATRPRLAVLPFLPTTPDTTLALPRASLRALLASGMANATRFQLVDREWTEAAFAEQEHIALQGGEAMGQLGQTLGADYLLSGSYQASADGIILDAHLIDVTCGTTSGLVSCRGTLERIDEMARQLETKLRLPRAPEVLRSAIPLRLAYDLDGSLGTRDSRDWIKAATLGRSRKAGDVFVAAERLERSDPAQTRTLLRHAFRRCNGDSPEELVRAARWLDRLLRPVRRTDERVEIWRRVLREIRHPDAREKYHIAVDLCEALCDAGLIDEAKQHMQPGPDPLRNVVLYDRMGMRNQAFEQCQRKEWLARMEQGIGPGYAGTVLLLQEADGPQRRALLIDLARHLCDVYPRQGRMALDELRATGGIPGELGEAYLKNAIRLGDRPGCREALDMVQQLPAKERAKAIGRLLPYAAKNGERKLVAELTVCLQAISSDDELVTRLQRLHAERGAPRISQPWRIPVFPAANASALIPDYASLDDQSVGSAVYILANTEMLYAYDTDTNRLLWQFDLAPLTPTYLSAKPTGKDGEPTLQRGGRAVWACPDAVYASACQDGRLWAVDPVNGAPKWQFTAWGPISPPVVSRDGTRVAVVDALGIFHVLDARSGQVLRTIIARDMALDAAAGRHVDLYSRYDRDTDYQRAVSDWATTSRHERPFLRARNCELASSRGGDSVCAVNYSLNLRTLECIRGLPPPAEDKETLLAKLTDRGVPSYERCERVTHSLDDLPKGVLLPTLIGIAMDGRDVPAVRDRAFVVLTENWPSRAIQTMADILSTRCRRPDAICPLLRLRGRVAAKLDDEAVAALIRLMDHPSVSLRKSAALDLVWALGRRSLPYIRDLAQSPEGLQDSSWRQNLVAAMAENDMTEAWPLAAPLVEPYRKHWGSTNYGEAPLEGPVRQLALCGCQQAAECVVLPFDQDKLLADLRQAEPPLTRKQLEQLRRPYSWISSRYPSPTLAPFLMDSLQAAPTELRRYIAAVLVRVSGTAALPTYVRETVHTLDPLRRKPDRHLLRTVADFDAGDDPMAWEQEVRLRANHSR